MTPDTRRDVPVPNEVDARRPAPAARLEPGDALVVVDVQRDFCTGGALAVAGGDDVVPVLNEWIAAAAHTGIPIVVSRDWHPQGHPSFESAGGPWPTHCVQGSPGAELHPGLELPDGVLSVAKGVRFDKDQTSVFDDTGIDAELRRLGVRRLWVGGLALDVCVRASVMDALRRGFGVHLIANATRAVDEEAVEGTLSELRDAGAVVEADG